MIERQDSNQRRIPYPAAGSEGIIEVNLDENVFAHGGDEFRWRHLEAMLLQEGVESVLRRRAIHAKFSYRNHASGSYCEPIFEICGRDTALKWEIFVREVTSEVAEDLFQKSQNPAKPDISLPKTRRIG